MNVFDYANMTDSAHFKTLTLPLSNIGFMNVFLVFIFDSNP